MQINSDLVVQRAGLIDNETEEILLHQIHAIASESFNHYKQSHLGLLSGKAGLILLHGYLSKLFPEKYSVQCENMAEELYEALENESHHYTMSSGIGGAAFALQHLNTIGFFEHVEDDSFDDLDDYLSNAIDIDIKSRNWDPLHGYIGLGIYFLERHSFKNQTGVLTKIVDALYHSRVDFENYKLWITLGYQHYSKDNYNFGMAHGMSGIVSFLSLVAAHNIEYDKCLEMVTDVLSFFSQYKTDQVLTGMFPTSIEVHDFKPEAGGRLGWCYGDFCVINAFIHAGKSFKNKNWIDFGNEIALLTTQRSFENSGIIDPCFCHGNIGTILHYYRYYKLTKDEKFKQALIHYLQVNLSHFYQADKGYGGYQYSSFDENTNERVWVNEIGLLEGSAGIALVYLSLVFDIEPKWDLIFLTNV